MKKDLTAAFDRLARRWRRRFLKERDLPVVTGSYTLRRVFEFLKPSFVFDVGANAGQYGDLLRQDVGYRGPLCSVEPIADIAQALQARVAGDAAWQVHALALGRAAGRAQFNLMAGSEFSSLMRPSAEFDGRFEGQHRVARVVDVEVDTLDALATRLGVAKGPRDVFLKLDTQGTELDVLEGGPRLLQRVVAIQTELSLKPIYEGAPAAQAAIADIQGRGFELAALFANNHGHFPRLLELDAVFIHTSRLPVLR